jgi:hypothetical protein
LREHRLGRHGDAGIDQRLPQGLLLAALIFWSVFGRLPSRKGRRIMTLTSIIACS